MKLSSIEHSKLVMGMSCGDERAAATLYDEYSRVMFALALRIVGETADAEEVVLDAFSQAWNGAANYQTSRSSVMSWLAMITRTRALDCVRARTRRLRAVAEAAIVMADEPVALGAAAPLALEKIEDDERAMMVTGALRTLARPQRVALELAFFNGLTHPEIAEFLGEPLGTVKTRIRLGMQHLRQMLSNRMLPLNTATAGRMGTVG